MKNFCGNCGSRLKQGGCFVTIYESCPLCDWSGDTPVELTLDKDDDFVKMYAHNVFTRESEISAGWYIQTRKTNIFSKEIWIRKSKIMNGSMIAYSAKFDSDVVIVNEKV